MKRLTAKTPEGWVIPREELVPLDGGMGGPAARRLAAFEEMAQRLLNQQGELSARLEGLRREGKTKTDQFRELMGKKLMNTQMLSFLQAYGLLEEGEESAKD